MSEETLRRAAVVTGGGGFIGRAIAIALAGDGHDIALWDLDDGRPRREPGGDCGRPPGRARLDVRPRPHRRRGGHRGGGDDRRSPRRRRRARQLRGGLLPHPHRRPRHGGLGPDAQRKPPGPGGVHPGLPPEHGRAGRGAIVNIASISAVVARQANLAYSASKAALLRVTRDLASRPRRRTASGSTPSPPARPTRR